MKKDKKAVLEDAGSGSGGDSPMRGGKKSRSWDPLGGGGKVDKDSLDRCTDRPEDAPGERM